MKFVRFAGLILFAVLSLGFSGSTFFPNGNAWIRINQMGYLPEGRKVAVLVSKGGLEIREFALYDALTNRQVYQGKKIKAFGAYAAFSHSWRLDFSEFSAPGAYYLRAGDVVSPNFRIGADVYDGAADFVLRYMRQQRSGYNPYLRDSCHVEDGFIVYHPDPERDSTYLDVAGGWHDASDYLQYLPTSANAVFQMLFAYRQNPESFGDVFNASGLPGSNGIPDIVDEAKWGMDWLLKLNPRPGEYYNQLADDRDHLKMRLPTEDSVLYATDKGFARPVYLITGELQGAFRHKNRTQGVSSSAGKFASAFALGSEILRDYYPEYAKALIPRAEDAYKFGKTKPGYNQTAPCRAPYFYEEENWTDDMELAAIQLHGLRKDDALLREAAAFGGMEPTTPWMGSDTARHYQWYPFMNMGHYFLAAESSPEVTAEFRDYMRRGIDTVWQRGKNNPFLFGVPFIWCSNNLVTAMLTQCRLYREVSGDQRYVEMENALLDWLFGCNPWGTSMIIGLPKNGIWPKDPHSAFTHLHNFPIDGGLVDGPIYGSIWNKLIGISLYEADEFEAFQSPLVVYHDDYGDYSSNEPTMDGTACMTYFLSALEKEGKAFQTGRYERDSYGAIIQHQPKDKTVYLCFTGHEFADGARSIRKTLKNAGIPGSFFFTGDFLRQFSDEVKGLKADGHYIGPHSDKHLLYCSWEQRDSTLIDKSTFLKDLGANYTALEQLGIRRQDAMYFMPPYEWYNTDIAEWSKEAGVQLVNFTPGTGTNADYTWPGLQNYRSSEELYKKVLSLEQESPDKVNGAHLLIHIGTDPRRKDKFYALLPRLIQDLREKGYAFGKFGE